MPAAKKNAKKGSSSFSLPSTPYLKDLKEIKNASKLKVAAVGQATLIVTCVEGLSSLKKELKDQLNPYQLKKLPTQAGASQYFEGKKGPLMVVVCEEEKMEDIDHEGLLDISPYASARDLVGTAYQKLEATGIDALHIHAHGLEYDEFLGALLGVELAHYDYKKKAKKLSLSATYNGHLPKEAYAEILENASEIGHAMNIARFLVDTPPGEKRPEDYAGAVEKFFSKKYGMTVDVWDRKRMEADGMGCILAVGQGSAQEPRLVHLKYRPKLSKNDEKVEPVALIGKGVTFDTGGLDIKPPAAMRLMKKDMGGSATLVGLAYWLTASKVKTPCDIYLAMAENSVGPDSFRPSDILTARNGMTVEIDNTDAEGRLVMADALCLASEAKGEDKPQCLIDVSTLTGAIKVGLGSDVAGLFSNSDDLAFILQSCSQIAGDLVWRMPLLSSQRKVLNSPVADIVNCASGFGGAISAAMFLKEFTADLPWAHLDIYSWTNGSGPYRHSGGSGQAVQLLAQFISQL